jgi:hypothetical protein
LEMFISSHSIQNLICFAAIFVIIVFIHERPEATEENSRTHFWEFQHNLFNNPTAFSNAHSKIIEIFPPPVRASSLFEVWSNS